ncbi:MAG: hypothetical protein A2W35_16205 [Chloroflexi bacterium RBG_16_57_11]|nr:MAG: hypothetical protein A2W35_16205 [Chloroflexi bacterium RBG_16_57_11]
MKRLDIVRLRLRNQCISEAPLRTPREVVGWLAAVQAQDYAGAKWALGLRLHGVTDDDLDQAFTDGSILRTHLLRPTWHFVTPDDIRWLLALTAPRVHAVNAYMYHKLELDRAVLERCMTVLDRALRNGRHLTRNELGDVLQQDGVATNNGLRLGYIMMSAELDGLVCSGARRGKQFTYALLEERAPQAMTLERTEALAELAHRYFLSRGPATVHDFAKWSGLTITDARHGLEAVSYRLQQEVIDGKYHWFSPSTPSLNLDSPTAYLLSIYDEYISGYKDRSAIGEIEVGVKLAALGNALSYVIMVDGQIVGSWKRTLRKDVVVIQTNYFRMLTKAENQAVALAAQRYGDYLGLPVIL